MRCCPVQTYVPFHAPARLHATPQCSHGTARRRLKRLVLVSSVAVIAAGCGGGESGSPWESDANYGAGTPGLFGDASGTDRGTPGGDGLRGSSDAAATDAGGTDTTSGAGRGGRGASDTGGGGRVEDTGVGAQDAGPTDTGRGGRGGDAGRAGSNDVGGAQDTGGGATDTGGGGGNGLPPHALLCAPCKSDPECGASADGTPAVCLDLGPEGSFCTSPCDPGATCPDGYACEKVPGPLGLVSQCVLAGDGECPCSSAASQAHLWTTCEVDVDGVGCPGVRGCSSAGELTPCTASGEGPAVCAGIEPDPCDALEICDGIDNDCDGVTDGMTQGCSSDCGSGQETCVAGSWQGCSAPSPVCLAGDACCADDGCSVLGTNTKCGTAPVATETSCSGSCGGTVNLKERWAYCDGSAGACGTSNLKWEDKGGIESCGSGNLCEGGNGSASCTSCPNGCSGGSCAAPETVYTVCVDPGYGGSSPGPSGSGLVGKDVTWSISQHLVNWLNADSADSSGGLKWEVVMTRGQNDGPSNSTRAATCNQANSHRVISIMTNACCGGKGAETYHAPGAGGTTTNFAATVQAEVVAHGGVTDRGVKTNDFTILTATNASTVQTFVGFIDSGVDGPKMASNSWRQEVALGLLQALQRRRQGL